MRIYLVALASILAAQAQPAYDLLLKGGHVIDPKNGISRVSDVAISAGKIARVSPDIPSSQSEKTVELNGL